MKIEVYFFDKDKFMKEFHEYQDYKNTGVKNRKMISPIDRNWNYWYSKKEIETSTFREFEIDRMPGSNRDIIFRILKLIEIDDDYLWDDVIDDRHYYYSWRSMMECDETKNMLYNITWKTFEDISDMINRDLKLKELI